MRSVLMYGPKDSNLRYLTYFYDEKEEMVHKKTVFVNKKASSHEIFYPSGNIRSRLTYDTDGSCYQFQAFSDVKGSVIKFDTIVVDPTNEKLVDIRDDDFGSSSEGAEAAGLLFSQVDNADKNSDDDFCSSGGVAAAGLRFSQVDNVDKNSGDDFGSSGGAAAAGFPNPEGVGEVGLGSITN
jgi:hypothetical protein